MVDNNLRPDRLADPKALEPNHCIQPTIWLHGLCLEVQAVHGTELRLFWAKTFPLLILLTRGSDIALVGTVFNIFSYDFISAEHRTNHLHDVHQADALHVVPC